GPTGSGLGARIRVTDRNGRPVVAAVVSVVVVPFGRAVASPARTRSDGWALLRFRSTGRLKPEDGPLAVFVKATRPGDDPLGGVSAARLVRLPVGAAPLT